MSSSIVGAGAADRINMVRWMILQEMATAWLVTIPLTASLAAVIEALLTRAT
jgi:PiT family inorganic phosphate transporter